MLEDVRLLEQMEGVQLAVALDQMSHTGDKLIPITIHWIGETCGQNCVREPSGKDNSCPRPRSTELRFASSGRRARLRHWDLPDQA